MKLLRNVFWCVLVFIGSTASIGAILTVRAGGGGDYTTIDAATTAASEGDTIRVINAVDDVADTFVHAKIDTLKTRCLLTGWSADGTFAYPVIKMAPPGTSIYGIRAGGDSIRVERMEITYNGATIVGTNYIVNLQIAGYGAPVIRHCIFTSDTLVANFRGIRFSNTNTAGEVAVISNCYFKNIAYPISTGLSDYGAGTRIDSCMFYRSPGVLAGNWWYVSNSVFAFDTLSPAGEGFKIVSSSSCDTVIDCSFNNKANKTSTQVLFTWTTNPTSPKFYTNCLISGCAFYPTNNVFVWTNTYNLLVYKSLFYAVGACLGNSASVTAGVADTFSYQSAFRKSYFHGSGGSAKSFGYSSGASPVDTGYWHVVDSCIIKNGGFAELANGPIKDDTISNFLYLFSNTDTSYFSYKTNVTRDLSYALLDSHNFPFHRANNSTYANLGPMKYLTNKSGSYTVGSTTAQTACSLSVAFKHDNGQYGYDWKTKNSWITKDTAMVYIEKAAIGGAFSKADSSLIAGGNKTTFALSGLSPSTQYVVRFTTIGNSAGTTFLRDTTANDTITTGSAAAPKAGKRQHLADGLIIGR